MPAWMIALAIAVAAAIGYASLVVGARHEEDTMNDPSALAVGLYQLERRSLGEDPYARAVLDYIHQLEEQVFTRHRIGEEWAWATPAGDPDRQKAADLQRFWDNLCLPAEEGREEGKE
jgi:hypothetical protein